MIADTAGRLHIDDELMAELKQVKGVLQPAETVFVADARRLGATRMGEEADLDQGDVTFRESLRSHAVATLENASLRVQLVP